ncbi:hypothetical protein GUJ93_ZPchr0010g8718 [Zizania palustris]|uniref:Uncharacterized protein n=1 Tax=Zizania palustris TaxID=103762 RepID=A0A8J5W7S4_ZIZPA|nr:hypothetical protein GUJ93_ZPchr0010g8718 [Zizania palustris]
MGSRGDLVDLEPHIVGGPASLLCVLPPLSSSACASVGANHLRPMPTSAPSSAQPPPPTSSTARCRSHPATHLAAPHGSIPTKSEGGREKSSALRLVRDSAFSPKPPISRRLPPAVHGQHARRPVALRRRPPRSRLRRFAALVALGGVGARCRHPPPGSRTGGTAGTAHGRSAARRTGAVPAVAQRASAHGRTRTPPGPSSPLRHSADRSAWPAGPVAHGSPPVRRYSYSSIPPPDASQENHVELSCNK